MDINAYLSAVVSGIAIIQGISMYKAHITELRKKEIDEKLNRVLDKIDRDVELLRATTVNVSFCNGRHSEIRNDMGTMRADISAIKSTCDAIREYNECK